MSFGQGEAYIHTIATQRRTSLDLINGTYSLDVEYLANSVFGWQEAEKVSLDEETETGVRVPRKLPDHKLPTQAEVD